MSDQKHLWSGDWERHSTRPSSVVPVQPDPEPPPEEPRGGRSRRRTLTVLGALVALLVIVGVVLAVTLGGGSTKHTQTHAFIPRPFNGGGTGGAPLTPSTPSQQSTTPQQASPTPTPSQTQQPSPVQIGPTYDWLGLQMSDTPTGVAVATVTIGGAADSAGVNPGDVITQVNSTQIDSIAQLESAVKSIKLGTRIQLTVDRGTTPVTISATLTNLPKRQS